MSAETGGRPVLRPAGNIAIRTDGRDTRPVVRKVTKPPSLPPVKSCPPSKTSPPNSPSKPISPKTPPPSAPQSRISVPNPLSKSAPDSSQSKLLLQQSARKSCSTNPLTKASFQINSQTDTTIRSRGPSALPSTCSQESLSSELLSDLDCRKQDQNNQTIRDPLLSDSIISAIKPVKYGPSNNMADCASEFRLAPSKGHGPGINLRTSSEEVFHKTSSKAKAKSRRNVTRIESLKMDETASIIESISAAKRATATELHCQKKLRVSQYGRIKQGKASRVGPDISSSLPPAPAELKRCKFITPQSDPISVAYHDEEWGVPVYDDRRSLTGPQS
eukprot:c18293_g1_i1 orf=961-1956(-)